MASVGARRTPRSPRGRPLEAAARIARADAEHAEHLAPTRSSARRGGLEAPSDRMGSIDDLAVVVETTDRRSRMRRREAPLARSLEADQRLVEAVDSHARITPRSASCRSSLRHPRRAISSPRRRAAAEPCPTQLGGNDLRGLDQRREVIEPYLALPQEPRGVHGEPDLAATASASLISWAGHGPGSARWRVKIPITWSKTAIGIASTARAPTSSRTLATPPSEGSSSSGAVSTSPIATVSRRRSARFVPGSRPANQGPAQYRRHPTRRRSTSHPR